MRNPYPLSYMPNMHTIRPFILYLQLQPLPWNPPPPNPKRHGRKSSEATTGKVFLTHSTSLSGYSSSDAATSVKPPTTPSTTTRTQSTPAAVAMARNPSSRKSCSDHLLPTTKSPPSSTPPPKSPSLKPSLFTPCLASLGIESQIGSDTSRRPPMR